MLTDIIDNDIDKPCNMRTNEESEMKCKFENTLFCIKRY